MENKSAGRRCKRELIRRIIKKLVTSEYVEDIIEKERTSHTTRSPFSPRVSMIKSNCFYCFSSLSVSFCYAVCIVFREPNIMKGKTEILDPRELWDRSGKRFLVNLTNLSSKLEEYTMFGVSYQHINLCITFHLQEH